MSNILFVTQNLSYGGASKMLLWVARQLSKNNNVEICYFQNHSNANIPQDIVCFKVMEKPLKDNIISRNTFNLMVLTQRIQKIIKEGEYDLVINFGDHAVYPLVLTKLFFKYRLLISERVDPYSSRKVSDKIRRYLYRFSDSMVFQTQKAMEYYPKKVQEKSTVIYNPAIGITTNKWSYEATDNSIISVARIDLIQKRQDLLLKAFREVLKTYPSVSLQIVGNGPDEERLSVMIKDLGLERNVKILGCRNDVKQLLLKSRLFVLTSDFEGIPNSLIEALQLGMPVISTDCSPGGARLLLDDGKYGILVERDDIKELSNAMVFALRKEELVSMSNKTKGALDRFKEGVISENWNNFITSVLLAK